MEWDVSMYWAYFNDGSVICILLSHLQWDVGVLPNKELTRKWEKKIERQWKVVRIACYVKRERATEVAGWAEDRNASPTLWASVDSPRPLGSSRREVATAGMLSWIALTGLGTLVFVPLRHACQEDEAEKTIVSKFTDSVVICRTLIS